MLPKRVFAISQFKMLVFSTSANARIKPPGLRRQSCKCRSQSIVQDPPSSSFSGKDRNKTFLLASQTFQLRLFSHHKKVDCSKHRHVGFCEGVPIPPRYSDLVDQFGIFYRCRMFSIGRCLNVPSYQILAEWLSDSKNALLK